MHKLKDDNQSAFLQGRDIFLTMLYWAKNLFHYAKMTTQPGIVIKINFEKAYNKIHWQ